ncbi:MAG TPA: hypothetical protein VEX61_05330 [Burkholderiales bacterium]|nr:hypothetical protein [Burkholderiales bacterium]
MKRGPLIAWALAVALASAGCESMSDTERRTLSGAALGGIVGGAVTGDWGWAAGGAAIGAAGGYLYDQHRESQTRAYNDGRRDGQAGR